MSTLARKSKEQLLKAKQRKWKTSLSAVWIRSMSFLEMLSANTVANAIKLWNRRKVSHNCGGFQAEFESLKHRPRELAGTCFTETRVAPAADVSSAAPPLKSSSLQDAEQ
jgi:hypothetical protein